MLLADRLDHVLVAARRSGVGPTLLFLDLDDFTQVNDQAGHEFVILGSPFGTVDTLLRDADSTMYAARAHGKNRAVLFPATAVDNDPVTVH